MRSDRVVYAIALLVLVAHLLTAHGYGIFRDEYYYLACANHLAWGYVDHPPLSIAVLAGWRAVFGDSMFALRVPPAILHALIVLGTAALASRMGARGCGRTLAAVCAAFAPGLLGLTSFYSMNAIELVLWVAALLVFARALERDVLRDWLLLGFVVGLGLLNKYSMAMLVLGMFVGILVSERGGVLRSKRPWLGLLVAVVLFAPHVLWQIQHDWPTREFIANAQQYKMAEMNVLGFLTQVWLEMQPPSVLVWVPGLIALAVWRPLRPVRPLGIAFVVVAAVLLVQKSKPYYLDAAFPIAFAAGGVWWEHVARTRGGRYALNSVFLVLAVSAVAIAPYAMPLLSVERFVEYNDVLGIVPSSGENHELGVLPQHFADRFGWPEYAEAVNRVYLSLTDEERAHSVIVARNYGQAGALLYHGRVLGLPRVIAQHNSFYLWGPGEDRVDVAIVVGMSAESLMEVYESVVERGRFDHPYAMPYERSRPIFVCKGLKIPLAEAWMRGRLYI